MQVRQNNFVCSENDEVINCSKEIPNWGSCYAILVYIPFLKMIGSLRNIDDCTKHACAFRSNWLLPKQYSFILIINPMFFTYYSTEKGDEAIFVRIFLKLSTTRLLYWVKKIDFSNSISNIIILFLFLFLCVYVPVNNFGTLHYFSGIEVIPTMDVLFFLAKGK